MNRHVKEKYKYRITKFHIRVCPRSPHRRTVYPAMTSTIFPISLYEQLLPKVVAVLELTQQTEGLSSQQAKQQLLHAVS